MHWPRLRVALQPVGSSVITLDQSTLDATGAVTIFDQLQSVPQIDNLGVTEASRNGTGGAENITYANSINIRGPSPFATLTPNGGGGFDPNVANPIGRLISVQLRKKLTF